MTAPTKDEVAEARRFFTTEPTRSIMPPWCATHGETILRALDAAEAERDELARWKETHSWSSTLRTRAETAEAERARAEKAEARVRELEAAIAEWAQAHDGTDYSVQVEMNGRLRRTGQEAPRG